MSTRMSRPQLRKKVKLCVRPKKLKSTVFPESSLFEQFKRINQRSILFFFSIRDFFLIAFASAKVGLPIISFFGHVYVQNSNVGYAFYADSILRLIPGPVWSKATSKTSCTCPSRPSWPDLAAQRRTMGFWLLQPSEVKLFKFFSFKML